MTSPAPRLLRYVVAKAADVSDGEHIVVDINGRSVGIFNIEDEFYGLLNRCPHQGGPMCEGLVVGLLESDRPGEFRFDADHKLLACPWHGWEFDIKTGESYFDPARTRIRGYPVDVESGDLVAAELSDDESGTSLVKGPYTAETVAVSVEQDYLVVRMRG